MKKWIIVVGLFGCSVLFFISGSFLGYLVSNEPKNEASCEIPQRTPSEKLEPILGRIAHTQNVEVTKKVRTPSTSAVYQAKQYNRN